MKQLTFLELAIKVLEEIKNPLSVEEIWEVAIDKGYDQEIGTKGKTPWRSIGARIYVSIRDEGDKSPFVKLQTSPTRFFLRSLINKNGQFENSKEPISIKKQTSSYSEHDLHSFLTYSATFVLKALTKTIKHNKSSKKEYGEWVHPDMVGFHFPIDEWKNEVLELSSTVGNVSIKLYSFEIKKELNLSNLREAFFQAVSNSSWANEGYLASPEISKNEDFRNELDRLTSSFGIGIFELNLEDPDSSEIIFPAKYKEYLDWETINKLATISPDFREFIKGLRNDISSREIRIERYDRVLETDDLIKTIKK